MMNLQPRAYGMVFGCALCLLGSPVAVGSAVVFGDYYRLGDDDPGAAAGNTGNATTVDSALWRLDLGRAGAPAYSADTSSRAVGSKLSMSFVNSPGSGGPASSPSYYSRTSSASLQTGYGLETWVKSSVLTPVDSSGYAVIAAVGDPFADGFGILQHGSNYVVRAGTMEKTLAPVSTDKWIHLAYVRTFNTDDFYVLGALLDEAASSTPATTLADTFALGADVFDAQHSDLFNGLIDETRLLTYNPLAAGAFSPAEFLISPVPEPSSLLLLGCAVGFIARRRARREFWNRS